MATAVQAPHLASAASPTTRLLMASVTGAVFVAAAVAVAGYVVPTLWATHVAPNFNAVANVCLSAAAKLAVVGVFAYVGSMLAGANPPKGLRGGIFLVISAAVTVFFIARAVALNLDPAMAAPAFGVGLAVLGVIAYRLLASPRAVGYMHAIEEQGLLHTNNYKRSLGLVMRRYTLLGILVLGLSGVWAMVTHATVGSGNLTMRIPGVDGLVTVLAYKEWAVPALLTLATLWFAWRAVNMPDFADFLIATEAEMNKVSWSTRRQLIQDTGVVLITTLFLTLFLLGVDLFWGWLLSRNTVGVLPTRDTTQQKSDPQGKTAEW